MIEVITGLPGMGKTLTATKWALKKMKLGKKVFANYPLEGAEYFNNVLDVLGKVKNALIVCDEMGIVFDQITMYQIPSWVWMELRQHRKDGVDILGTAQSIYDIAYPVRRLIQFEYNIYFKFGKLVAVKVRNPQPYGDKYCRRYWWLSKKVFSKYDTYHKVNDVNNSLNDLEDKSLDVDVKNDVFKKYVAEQEELLINALRRV